MTNIVTIAPDKVQPQHTFAGGSLRNGWISVARAVAATAFTQNNVASEVAKAISY